MCVLYVCQADTKKTCIYVVVGICLYMPLQFSRSQRRLDNILLCTVHSDSGSYLSVAFENPEVEKPAA